MKVSKMVKCSTSKGANSKKYRIWTWYHYMVLQILPSFCIKLLISEGLMALPKQICIKSHVVVPSPNLILYYFRFIFLFWNIFRRTCEQSHYLWFSLTSWSSLYYSMQKTHAVVCNEGGKVFIEKASPEAKLMVNGDPVTSKLELDNNDR